MRFRLRPVRDSEMMMVFHWRNDPRVRAVMPFSRELQVEAHRQWWASALADPERRMMILEDRHTPVAVIVFLDLRHCSPRQGASAKWGFYTSPRSEIGKSRSLAAWVACQIAALAYAFDVLRLDTLYCETLQTHTPVLRLSGRVGFETVGRAYLARDKPPFVVQRLTRAAFQNVKQHCPLLTGLGDVEIQPDPRD